MEVFLQDTLMHSAANTTNSKTIVTDAVARALNKIFDQGLTPWKFYPRNTLPKIEPSATLSKNYVTELSHHSDRT
ncbi:hypothetical protein DID88_005994 [Monilinia fructigena]|uniref:Uncharacterized protein n=1 Tax=Monilinia fructigena TaxID=38457 RepID=A0A395J2K3_9HELO|nr:hypothetical protein DID88_005994 [Monilinia fructigena]